MNHTVGSQEKNNTPSRSKYSTVQYSSLVIGTMHLFQVIGTIYYYTVALSIERISPDIIAVSVSMGISYHFIYPD
jgi:hypothetical protein